MTALLKGIASIIKLKLRRRFLRYCFF
ncbi:hypothetical protein KSF78_0002021 [Schistosoma japonicum]|nr:hypothetical protein KSF78_0002021 [Schistosoma japonicum]